MASVGSGCLNGTAEIGAIEPEDKSHPPGFSHDVDEAGYPQRADEERKRQCAPPHNNLTEQPRSEFFHLALIIQPTDEAIRACTNISKEHGFVVFK